MYYTATATWGCSDLDLFNQVTQLLMQSINSVLLIYSSYRCHTLNSRCIGGCGMFAIVVMACVSCAPFLIQDFANYFFYDRLVTSFKRVIKDKELLFIACCNLRKTQYMWYAGRFAIANIPQSSVLNEGPCAPHTTDCGNKDSNH